MQVAVDGSPLRAGRIEDTRLGAREILVCASSFMTLHAGDVILTGFPGASAAIVPGATVACTVGGIGTPCIPGRDPPLIASELPPVPIA